MRRYEILQQAPAQTTLDSSIAFDVASLKPVNPTPPYPVTPGVTKRGTTVFTNCTLAECLRFAFDITSDDRIGTRADQITGRAV
jgi:uncharacterized protein (TIGR03435 family)